MERLQKLLKKTEADFKSPIKVLEVKKMQDNMKLIIKNAENFEMSPKFKKILTDAETVLNALRIAIIARF